jgi:hypothetical protein
MITFEKRSSFVKMSSKIYVITGFIYAPVTTRSPFMTPASGANGLLDYTLTLWTCYTSLQVISYAVMGDYPTASAAI